ncbi:MAG TPA: sigma factor [Candidatus Paceibacterota bacterium]|nr:sigma factor [Verrucomicrobiota bacterium]HRY47979.1 sigma factor [Candidatus Paceibacterota bacterium]
MNDWQVLQDYVTGASEQAFSELMDRHLGLVFSTAFRVLGNTQAAEDATQAVFCLLANKARDLPPGTLLVGWLYQTAFFIASRQKQSDRNLRGSHQRPGLWLVPRQYAD